MVTNGLWLFADNHHDPGDRFVGGIRFDCHRPANGKISRQRWSNRLPSCLIPWTRRQCRAPPYFLEADYLSDLMRDMGEFKVVTFGQIYDAEGRIVADVLDQLTRFSVTPDPSGKPC